MQNNEADNRVVITVNPGAFLNVEGSVTVKNDNGDLIKEADKLFLCRCGASSNKPFCDGSHRAAKFEAE